MSHQDWNIIILKKPKNKTCEKRNFFEKKEKEGPEEIITQKLKQLMINVRVSHNKKQDDMVKLCGQRGFKVILKEIQDMESGKLSMKRSKQVALCYEKVLNIKLLEKL